MTKKSAEITIAILNEIYENETYNREWLYSHEVFYFCSGFMPDATIKETTETIDVCRKITYCSPRHDQALGKLIEALVLNHQYDEVTELICHEYDLVVG